MGTLAGSPYTVADELKNHPLYLMRLHRAAQMQRSCQVIMIIPQRLLTGLAYRLQTREMNDCRNRLLIEYTIHALLIEQIHLIKREVPSVIVRIPSKASGLELQKLSSTTILYPAFKSSTQDDFQYIRLRLLPGSCSFLPHTVIICFRISTACAAALAENSA